MLSQAESKEHGPGRTAGWVEHGFSRAEKGHRLRGDSRPRLSGGAKRRSDVYARADLKGRGFSRAEKVRRGVIL